MKKPPTPPTPPQPPVPHNNDDDDATRESSDVCVALFYVLLGVLWLAWIVVVLVLLAQDPSLDANGQCGYLWEFMLVRTVCFALELTQRVIEKCVLEDEAGRACLGLEDEQHQQLLPSSAQANDDDGCLDLIAGQSPLMHSVGLFVRFAYNGGFVIAALLILPNALMDHAPCCLKAMAASSFTGTYTLGVFAWAYLVLDCVMTTAYAIALLQRRDTVRIVLPAHS